MDSAEVKPGSPARAAAAFPFDVRALPFAPRTPPTLLEPAIALPADTKAAAVPERAGAAIIAAPAVVAGPAEAGVAGACGVLV